MSSRRVFLVYVGNEVSEFFCTPLPLIPLVGAGKGSPRMGRAPRVRYAGAAQCICHLADEEDEFAEVFAQFSNLSMYCRIFNILLMSG